MMSELEVLKKCSHPNLMSVHEILEDDNCFYIISEILQGGELFERLLKEKKFGEAQGA
jgi:serine/threonine protein kinase